MIKKISELAKEIEEVGIKTFKEMKKMGVKANKIMDIETEFVKMATTTRYIALHIDDLSKEKK